MIQAKLCYNNRIYRIYLNKISLLQIGQRPDFFRIRSRVKNEFKQKTDPWSQLIPLAGRRIRFPDIGHK